MKISTYTAKDKKTPYEQWSTGLIKNRDLEQFQLLIFQAYMAAPGFLAKETLANAFAPWFIKK